MKWNDTVYTEITTKYPSLDSKPESVALAVWALTQNKDITSDGWRELSEKTGVKVAGRAIGSARETLGIKTPKPAKKKGKRGRPKGSKNKPKVAGGRRGSGSGDPVGDLVAMLTRLQRERNEAVAVLDKIRRSLDSV